MQTKKKDGTLNCALCDKPRKSEYYTICDEHSEEYLRLSEIGMNEKEWKDMNRRISENLE